MGSDRDNDRDTVREGPGDLTPGPGEPTRWKYAVPVIALLAGLLFTASATTARGTDLRAGTRTEVAELIAAEQHRHQLHQHEYRELRAEIDALSRDAGQRDSRVERARQRASDRSRPAHFTALRGPAIQVTLDDAHPRRGRTLPGSPGPNDLVVHEQDVQGVVNALWAGGAEAMQIMDQRVIATTAVRCVGNTLLLQGVVYSPPFTITAIGDPERMRAALDASDQVAIYRQYVDAYGLGYSVKTLDEATLPGYSGAAELEYATVHDS